MGGHFQPMGQTLFLTNLLEYGLDIQEALDLPRLFPLRRQGARSSAASRATSVERLAQHGPRDRRRWNARMAAARRSGSTAQRGCLVGGSEPRKDGMALGY